MLSNFLDRINKLSNIQISALMFAFSLILVFVGVIIWRAFGPLNFVTAPKPVTVATTNSMVTDLVEKIGADLFNVVELGLDESGVIDSTIEDVAVIFVLGSSTDKDILSQLSRVEIVPVSLDRNINQLTESNENAPYWMSLPNVMLISKNITETLVQLHPDNAETIDANHNLLSTQIAKEDIKIRNKLNSVSNKQLLSLGIDLAYFARDYGFESQLVTLDNQLGQNSLTELNQLLNANSVDVVYLESSQINPLLQDWANENQVSLVTLKSSPDGEIDTFMKLMEYNVSQVSNSL